MPLVAQVIGGYGLFGGVISSGTGGVVGSEPGSGVGLLGSLVAHWKLDEASGQRNDSVGALHLADNNTVLQAAAPANLVTSALFASASSEYLSVADATALKFAGSEGTIAGWIYHNAQNLKVAFGKDTTGQRDYLLAFNISAGLDWTVFNSAGSGFTVATTGAIPNDTWTFFICSLDVGNSLIKISINAGAYDTAAFTGTPASATSAFNLGRREFPGFESYFSGRLCSISKWDRLLTAQEATDLYNGGAGLPYPF